MPPSATVATEAPPAPKEKFRKDYKPPPYLIDTVELNFKLDDEGLATRVRSVLKVRKNSTDSNDFILDATDFELIDGSLKIDGKVLDAKDYVFDRRNEQLKIKSVAQDSFVFESEVEMKPAENKAYEGLYLSGGNYVTQCEAEGFRKICPFPDRPDVMAKYTCTIDAPKERFPVLLSNGNCIEKKDLGGGRHFAKYYDPWPKASYLFALVAGDLVHLEDTFTTMSGKKVTLRIYVRDGDLEKSTHAMESLKKAMKWDEDKYGYEYDLDIFNIVAVPDFNMGAMENKSLNIFNSKYILCSNETATDGDFYAVEKVVAHENFHGYTGNRITNRSWFELSLKEGLTVFRDQSFSQDMSSPAVRRIQDVFILRSSQFPEDAGPMAHPVRPDSYITCNNFYTVTVYKKGAEVVRMLHTMLGPKGYRAGTDLYLKRHDGQAVTCDDWVQVLQDANPGTNFDQFRLWYSQAGTPELTVSRSEGQDDTLTLEISQKIPDTRGQTNKKPMHIPLLMGLVGKDGSAVKVDVGDGTPPADTKLIHIRNETQTVTLRNVPKGTLPSLLRDFSAPVELMVKPAFSNEELALLMASDSNSFARWEAGQTMMLNVMLDLYNSNAESLAPVPDILASAMRKALEETAKTDRLFAEVLLALPSESYMVAQVSEADPVKIRAVRRHVKKFLATKLASDFESVYEDCAPGSDKASRDIVSQGKRALRNAALDYLVLGGGEQWRKAALEHARNGGNMTAVMGALRILCQVSCSERATALSEFYEKWKHDALVLDKWFSLQSTATTKDVVKDVEKLFKHEAFDLNNPNKCYSLLGGFASMNMHIDESGAGYTFIADKILLIDRSNPQVAARIARAFSRLNKFTKDRQKLMRKECERMKSAGVSKDVYEVVAKTLDP